MANIRAAVPFKDVVVSASTTKTLATLTAPANQRLIIHSLMIHTQSVDNTEEPVKVMLQVASADGTPSLTPAPRPLDDVQETPQATAGVDYGGADEPTIVSDSERFRAGFTPRGGIAKAFDDVDRIVVPGGGIYALTVTTGAASIVASGMIVYEE